MMKLPSKHNLSFEHVMSMTTFEFESLDDSGKRTTARCR